MLRKISKINKSQFESVAHNTTDIIKLDSPLIISLLEYAKEPTITDVDLHKIAERLIEYSKSHVVTMDCYYDIIDKPEDTTTPPVLTEKSTLFRMNSRTLWSRFGWGPLNYSIALNNNLDGLEATEKRIYNHSSRIGDFIVPYYGEEIGKTVGDALTEFTRIGVKVMQDLKNGIPLDGTKERWDQSIENIAAYLSTINPEYWPKDPVKSYFDTLVNFWIDSIKSREAKDFAANEIAMDGIEKLISLGTSDAPCLADVFSAGVISQFPEKFTD